MVYSMTNIVRLRQSVPSLSPPITQGRHIRYNLNVYLVLVPRSSPSKSTQNRHVCGRILGTGTLINPAHSCTKKSKTHARAHLQPASGLLRHGSVRRRLRLLLGSTTVGSSRASSRRFSPSPTSFPAGKAPCAAAPSSRKTSSPAKPACAGASGGLRSMISTTAGVSSPNLPTTFSSTIPATSRSAPGPPSSPRTPRRPLFDSPCG